jgi:hypothetical protein
VQQFTLSKQLYDGVLAAQKAQDDNRGLRERSAKALAERNGGLEGNQSPERLALQAFIGKLTALEGQPAAGFGAGGRGAAPQGPDTLANITGGLTQLMGLLQGADVTPTTQLTAAVAERRAALNKLLARWNALKNEGRSKNLVIG